MSSAADKSRQFSTDCLQPLLSMLGGRAGRAISLLALPMTRNILSHERRPLKKGREAGR
ncbi:MAG: hypothetical protein WA885_05440 [Phormidesmis sp.]